MWAASFYVAFLLRFEFQIAPAYLKTIPIWLAILATLLYFVNKRVWRSIKGD